jgi:pimeloyl-ACP methyl ester carboxylesterase
MNKLSFLVIIVLMLGLLSCVNKGDNSKEKNTFLLIHGAWHGAWCWDELIPYLEEIGNKVLAIDLPGHGKDTTSPEIVTMDSYILKVEETLKQIDEKVILVGHSLGGSVITLSAESYPEEIKALVYISAVLPTNGQTVFQALADPNPTDVEFYTISGDGKTIEVLRENAKEAFYQDCEEELAQFAISNLSVQPMAPYYTTFNLSEESFGKTPRYFIKCSNDNVFSNERQEKWIKDSPCKKVYSMNTGHSPFLSRPEELSSILDEIGNIENSSPVIIR